jgi:hypothetical protein
MLLQQPSASAAVPDQAAAEALSADKANSRKSRRLSARDFFRDLNLSMMDTGPKDSWELVMGSGDREVVDALDVVLMGHTDG